ncbi:MAG TPA: hypothetical protein VK801_02675 [Caulobacteraceae bacterium]|jgi:hypothetical protein|nr:hypothetical protein [Caulobacteraceae bacterium]
MARLRFIARGHDHQVCEVFGREFPHGAWVEASEMDPEHLALLADNPTFESDFGVAKATTEAPPAPRRAEIAPGKGN